MNFNQESDNQMSISTLWTNKSLYKDTVNNGNFYVLGNNKKYKYHLSFPFKWAIKHWSLNKDDFIGSSSGPECCNTCNINGSINGVFVGYCENCFDNIYKGKRGGRCNASFIKEETIHELWEAFPYMLNTYINDIGDINDKPKDNYENSGCEYIHIETQSTTSNQKLSLEYPTASDITPPNTVRDIDRAFHRDSKNIDIDIDINMSSWFKEIPSTFDLSIYNFSLSTKSLINLAFPR
jgi:hypothetical protein